MDSYLKKIKKDSQYQLKEILNWTIYLEYLQAVLKECDPITAFNENILI